ncbi:hypothetical protein [Pectobacterium sp. 21LCBS03]|uniref:hypothetical protein n=1 Tax=Pectobacterium sp. 21LCBS03 TaxID=2935858 RepID=UPI0020103F3F|nr:hypothetical protein [Pectobacterium sp. 21LCBS03]UPY96248.1 hypothetical protein MYB54_05950 [Pectobacterium sp. 21LCBS03]
MSTEQERGKRIFAEISNQQVGEDGEIVGYLVQNKFMNELEELLTRDPVVKLPTTRYWSCGVDVYDKRDVIECLRAAGITVKDE